MSKFDEFEENNFFENEEQTDKPYLSEELEEQLAAIRKKDRLKMIVLGFAAGLMVAVGAGIYISNANADSSIDSGIPSGYTSGVSGSYTDYSSGTIDPSGASGASGGAGGGGCCGGGAGGGSASSASSADLEKQALDEYKKEPGAEKDVTAKAKDYGCHTQIDISDKSGKVIRSYGFQGGPLYVIK